MRYLTQQLQDALYFDIFVRIGVHLRYICVGDAPMRDIAHLI